jgi:hypothetical protein
MNRSNFKLSMDYSCNHKGVCELSASRALRTQVAFHLALSQGERTKVRGSIQGTCDFSKRKSLTLPSPFSEGRTDGKTYDIDFFLTGQPGKMKVTETSVHKIDGKPLYNWKEENGKWNKVPVS